MAVVVVSPVAAEASGTGRRRPRRLPGHRRRIIVLLVVFGVVTTWRYRRRRRARVPPGQLAAAEAADDDAAFDADALEARAADLHRAIVAAWSAGDRAALAGLLGPDLMVEWARRLDDFDRKGWHNRREIKRGPTVEYVGLTNRAETPRTARSSACRRCCATSCSTAAATCIKRNDSELGDHDPRRVLDAGQARRRRGSCSRSSRTPRAGTSSTRRSSPRRGATTACTTSP